MERLEKTAIILDIIGVLIYIILTAIDRLSPLSGSQIPVPPELSWSVLIALAIGIAITVIVHVRHRKYIKRIDHVEAFIFFPKDTPEVSKTLEYHQKNFHKKVIVNFKISPPEAYYLHASDKSYGWRLIQKYTNIWRSEVDTGFSIEKWCTDKEFHLNPWDASKDELESTSLDASINKLGDHDLDDYKIIYLYPWYTFTLSKLERLLGPSKKRVLLKISTNQAFETMFGDLKLIEKKKIHVIGYTRKPLESPEDCLKRHDLTFVPAQCPDDIFRRTEFQGSGIERQLHRS